MADRPREIPVLVERLTPREHEVLVLVADGRRNKDIARELGITDHTVKFHLAAVFGKLGASSRTEAVRRGLQLGLIHI
ncbi:MAG: helix-turn-helix transcriptional regulator [Acidobacteria bacterium]|nr:helix-turn-helix transcriptional regulator [Acidobacteriota bacterium]